MIQFVELYLYELSESRRIVVSRRLGVTECLHQWRRCQYFLLHLRLRRRAADSGEVSHCVFRRHRLAGSRLARHDDRLIVALSET